MPPVTVRLPEYMPVAESSALSAIPPKTVQVLPVVDKRSDASGGSREAAFGVPMGDVRFAQSPAHLLGNVIVSELESAGHTVSDAPSGVRIAATMSEFKVHTDTTPLYWDVIGDLAISLQVSSVQNGDPPETFEYKARCTERTYIWPTESVIAGVMGECVSDFGKQFRNDGGVANALSR